MTIASNPTPAPTPDPIEVAAAVVPDPEQTFEQALTAQFEPAAEEPAPESSPPADTGAEAPSPAAAAEGGERAGGLETPQPPAPPAALPEHYEILGRTVTPAQAEAALNVYEWAQKLTPEQVQAVERALAEGAPTAPALAAQAPAPAPASTPTPVAAPADPYEDPAITQMRAELEQLRAQVTPQPQVQQQVQPQAVPFDQPLHDHRVAVAQDVMRVTSEGLGLNQAEQELIGQRIVASGELGRLEQRTGDFRAAMQQAVEQQVWLDPFFRDKAITAQAAKNQAATDATQERKAASTALGGSTGSAPRQAPTNQRPASREEALTGMAAEIAASIAANRG